MNYRNTKGAMQKLSVVILIITVIFYGCENSSEVQTNSLSVTFFSEGSLQKTQINSLELTSVKILVRNLRLKKSGSNDSSDIKLGPFVANLNPNGIRTEIVIGSMPNGLFERIKFEIHKLEDPQIITDPDFIGGNSGSERYSAVIIGKFNGIPFTYKSQRTTYQELEFPVPISFENNSQTNLTIKVNPYTWFFNNGDYVDPNDPSNKSDIEMNIEHSFKDAFRDNNMDGSPD